MLYYWLKNIIKALTSKYFFRRGFIFIMRKSSDVISLQEKLYQLIYQQIHSGKLKQGDKLPSENEFAKKYQISRVTVRKALQKLVDEKLIVKKHGLGAFVSQPSPTESLVTGGSFSDSVKQVGCHPSTKIISFKETVYDFTDNTFLNGANVYQIDRLRIVDNTPVIYEIDYFPTDYTFVKTGDFLSHSFFKGIEKYLNLIPNNFEEYFQIFYANQAMASHLEVRSGSPVMEVTQVVNDKNGAPIYVNKQYIDSSKYIYAVKHSK
ncbi:GntR family transcriptional regulator [Pediococcus acidilactici]|nr:UTRA domain-containing protein [Pediococcus acidilactici]MCT3036815.1 GntR family transcriptional regulator [Pediococcus acidilactici]